MTLAFNSALLEALRFTLPKNAKPRGGYLGASPFAGGAMRDQTNREARLTGAQAAKAVGVSRQLVQYWHDHCGLTKDENGLYRLGDVMAIEKTKRRDSQSRRGIRLANA